MVRCKSCGRTIGEEYIYCTFCGKETPKMEMIKKTESSGKNGIPSIRFINRISSDFHEHYYILVIFCFLAIILLLNPMFQITKKPVNQDTTTQTYMTSKLMTCLKDNYELNGKQGVMPEEMKLFGGLLVGLNILSVILIVFFIFKLILHKDDMQTYDMGRIALNTALISLFASILLYTFLPMTIYGEGKFQEGIELASTKLTVGAYITAAVFLFTRFRLLTQCSERISHWRYLTR